MNKSIIKPSKSFKKNLLRKKALHEVCNDCLYRINAVIEMANKSNKNKVAIKLPTSFNIPDGINHKEFQIEVYYNIVDILQGKEYTVRINFKSSDETILHISWDIGDSALDISSMMNKLKKITI